MDMEDCILSSTIGHQRFDDFKDHAWQQQQILSSSVVDATKRLWPDDLQSNQCNPLVFTFEDWPMLDDLGFDFMPSALTNPPYLPELELESPISNGSSTNARLFGSAGIDPNYLFRSRYNKPASASSSSLPDFPDPLLWGDSQLESSQSGLYPLSPEEFQEPYDIKVATISQSPNSSDSISSPEPELEIDLPKRKRSQKQRLTKSIAKTLSPKHQTAHNIIEKRYRNNINNKIAALRDSIPSLRITTEKNNSDRESAESDLDRNNQPQKLNKATIMSKAIEYISYLEKESENLAKQNTVLKSKVMSLEGLILSRRKGSLGIQRLGYS